MTKPNPHNILSVRQCMMDIYHCFGLSFARHLTIEDKPYEKVSWHVFRMRNYRLKKKGKWFFDDWLIDKLKQGAYLFGYYLNELEVMMPKIPLPLILLVPTQYGDKPYDFIESYCLMIAPRVPDTDLYLQHVECQQERRQRRNDI